MAGSLTQTEVCVALLRSLADADTGVWCFVPTGSSVITWRSASFREMLVPDASVSGEIDYGSDSLALPDPLKELLEGDDTAGAVLFRRQKWSVRTSIVSDENGVPYGTLIHLELPDTTIGATAMRLASQEALAKLATLSPREEEVLDLIYEGLTNKAIAARSHISQKTVEKHRGRISRKLQTTSVAELVRLVATARMGDYAGDSTAIGSHPQPTTPPAFPQ